MPLPARVHALAVEFRGFGIRDSKRNLRSGGNRLRNVLLTSTALFVALGAGHHFTVHAQSDVSDADLTAASGPRVVRLGSASGAGRPVELPLEVYVARVLAGEAEPRAAEGSQRALAIAIRTFAIVNAGRHAREGFDLCDSTHCQVPRAATATTRRATRATTGQVLTRNGTPAEVFYSASCGGYSESAAEVWPGADYPYMPAAPDEMHAEDAPWTLALTLREIEQSLRAAGFQGQLTSISIDGRNVSGRVTRLRLAGLRPDLIAGDRFRGVIGATRVRSTAFTLEPSGESVRLTGRGYGHGVGMCVIGAARRAARGDSAEMILSKYFPGLEITRLAGASAPASTARPAPASIPRPGAASMSRAGIVVNVGGASGITADQLFRVATQAHDDMVAALGSSVAPISIRVHESIDTFRAATNKPWWVSAVSIDTSIDLVPASVLAQREGVEFTLRTAMAEVLVAESLRGRPAWVRVGAARYFGRGTRTNQASGAVRCPSDAELNLAVSAAAQRDAESRAEACFAREYARTGDWRAVR
ncbi:MAG: SpoIID/LytB domain-containing protein [Acidobacteria bacterium]|nr:SpoIID/LytB domain-containing protein [Acidobacteriota bacterium]